MIVSTLCIRRKALNSSATVGKVMRCPPVTALFSDTLSSIAEKMVTCNIGSVIVMSGDAPTGIITERDIVRRIVIERRDPDQTLAQAVMSSPLVTIEADKSVTEALQLMRNMGIRRLVVVQDDKLVGIVTKRRLLRALV
jgi:CBS domain-containing protein